MRGNGCGQSESPADQVQEKGENVGVQHSSRSGPVVPQVIEATWCQYLRWVSVTALSNDCASSRG